ncbi:YciI family protein [Actinomadura alba]|uniref:YCII-related domain-containing protein n=1 Tax=Actinomadura alba TaxID=406431 RepID=A0ABR7LWM8_9ACTN|nr:YciI family protein [Actinomadura alba]MBC6469068.1 hypothetical protein [Actinomadura alba]
MLHLLTLRYLAATTEVEPHVAGHVHFLERYHRQGIFLISGPTVPAEEGGVIVARGVDRAHMEDIAAEDPFVRAGVAAYQVVTIAPGRMHPMVSDLLAEPLVRAGSERGDLPR